MKAIFDSMWYSGSPVLHNIIIQSQRLSQPENKENVSTYSLKVNLRKDYLWKSVY